MILFSSWLSMGTSLGAGTSSPRTPHPRGLCLNSDGRSPERRERSLGIDRAWVWRERRWLLSRRARSRVSERPAATDAQRPHDIPQAGLAPSGAGAAESTTGCTGTTPRAAPADSLVVEAARALGAVPRRSGDRDGLRSHVRAGPDGLALVPRASPGARVLDHPGKQVADGWPGRACDDDVPAGELLDRGARRAERGAAPARPPRHRSPAAHPGAGVPALLSRRRVPRHPQPGCGELAAGPAVAAPHGLRRVRSALPSRRGLLRLLPAAVREGRELAVPHGRIRTGGVVRRSRGDRRDPPAACARLGDAPRTRAPPGARRPAAPHHRAAALARAVRAGAPARRSQAARRGLHRRPCRAALAAWADRYSAGRRRGALLRGGAEVVGAAGRGAGGGR